MSSSLYWRPPNPEGEYLGYELKFALREVVGETYIGEWIIVDKGLIPSLEGVAIGAGKDSDVAKQARALIKLIEKHGSVDIREIN